jgi:hypothetical protein
MDLLKDLSEGFHQGNSEMMDSLLKALEGGTGVDAASFTGGRALQPESLDTTLVNVLWSQDEAKLFKALKKQPVKSVAHQWVRRTEVGDEDGAWVPEGGDSVEKDQTIERSFVLMKYLQTLRKVTLQASIANMIEDAVALEKQAGTLWIIKQVEKILFNGDSDVIVEQPDGLDKLITAAPTSQGTVNVIDLRGKTANTTEFEEAMTEAARIIRANFGIITDLYCSLMVMKDVQALLRNRIRFEAKREVLGGAIFTEYPTPFGTPKLVDDIFIQEKAVPRASVIVASRPSAPTISLAVSGTSSEFGSGDEGTYSYIVCAVNKFGESIPSANSEIAVGVGEQVDITITDGSTAGTGWVIYRAKKGETTGHKKCFQTKRTGSPQVVSDTNAYLPGTSTVYALNLNPMYDAIEWEQFLPMMKFDLYPTNAAVYPFLMLLFGALGLKKREQQVRIINISPSNLDWF